MSLNQGDAVASSSSQQEDVSWGDDEPAPSSKQTSAAKKKAAKQKAAAAAATKKEEEAQQKREAEAAAAAEAANAAKAASEEQKRASPRASNDLSASPVFASVTPALDSPSVPPPSSSAPAFTPTPEPTLEPAPQPSSHSRRQSQSPDESAVRNASLAGAADPHPHSHVDLIDWKLAESKGGGQYIAFLFELFYKYEPATLLQMQQAHSQMISTRRTAAEAAAAAAAGEILDSPPSSQSAPFPSSVTIVVSKRFSELHSFHSLLERHFVCLPPFPSKTLGKHFEKDFIDSRCMTLTNYLQQIMLRQDIMKTGWFAKFMGVPSPAQQLRAAKAALQAQMRDGARKQKEQSTAVSRQRAPSTAAAVNSSSSSTSYARRHDSAFEDAPANAHAHHAVEVEAASTAVGTPVTQSERHLTEEEEHGFEEEHSSEPNTRSASVAAGAHDPADFASGPITLVHAGGEMSPAVLVEGPSIDDMGSSDDEFETKFNDPTNEIERDGRRVPVVPERRKADSRNTQADPAYVSFSDLHAGQSASSDLAPSSVALEFISRSPMFSMLKTILVDPYTLLCCAADQSTVAKVDSWLSSLFGGKKSDAVTKKQDVMASSSATFTSSSASAEIANPLGALYAFRRANVSSGTPASVPTADDDFAQSLHIFFPRELTGMEWDAERRWIYVVDNKGGLTIFNPSPDFDYSVKILHLQIFSDSAPITHLKFVPTLGSGSLLLASAPGSLTSTSKQLVTRFDLHSQAIMHGTSFQFNSRDGPNKYEEIQAMEFDAEQRRMFLASQGRMISIYDMDNNDAAAAASAGRVKPPALLHRLLNGHEGAVKCLALDAHNSLLASGGSDHVIVLWNLGPRGAERTTSIWARLHGHTAKVTTVAFAATADGAAASRLLVSGDSDGHVCVWDTRRRGCVLAFRAHTSAVLSVQLTARMTLVTASEDKSTKLWQLS